MKLNKWNSNDIHGRIMRVLKTAYEYVRVFFSVLVS